MERFVATVRFGDDLPRSFRDRALKQYIEAHPGERTVGLRKRATGYNAS
jgi:hypothetical protein